MPYKKDLSFATNEDASESFAPEHSNIPWLSRWDEPKEAGMGCIVCSDGVDSPSHRSGGACDSPNARRFVSTVHAIANGSDYNR